MSPETDSSDAEPRKLTEEDARALCERLAATHADRATHQWLPRRPMAGSDSWRVVKVAIPPPADNLGTEIRADERPETPDDPRSAHDRNVGPWVGPG